MLKTPISKAEMTMTTEEKVQICPTTPTEDPNVSPMSISSILVTGPGDRIENIESTSEVRMSFLSELLLARDRSSLRCNS
jgi:hypothetical protein